MRFSRRTFLTAAAGAVGTVWLPLDRMARAGAEDGPAGFPDDVEVFRQRYQNWSKEVVIDDLWTCRPDSPQQVLEVVAWAATNAWKVRARGSMHGWSPILVAPGTTRRSPVVLVDTSGLAAVSAAHRGVRAGAGALSIDVLTHLEQRGLGLVSVPAVGEITIGGMLAIGAHGAALPLRGVSPAEGACFGSLSHAVRELTAVVWDRGARRYVLRTFGRGDAELASLVCALGRTFIVEAVLDASPLEHLRCRSYVDITDDELFAPGGSHGRTIASFFERTGRAEALWYPFTDKPWLKVWEVSESQPLGSRRTTGPYGYVFSDRVPEPLADLARELVTGHPELAPTFGQLTYDVTVAGLAATAAYDLWGPAKDTQLYIQASTLRVRELGLAVLTSRRNLQQTAHVLAMGWLDMVRAYADSGRYPINMPFEIRASALDGALGASPILTATSPDPSAPDLDVVLFTNPLTLTGTPGSDEFLAEYEAFVRARVEQEGAQLGHLRAEWSKNFAYTASGPAKDPVALASIRQQLRRGRRRPASWDGAAATLERLDPAGIFTNDFLDDLFER